MKVKSITKRKALRNKIVLLRCDLNVSLANGKFDTTDLWKLESIIPTVEFLRKKGARIVLISHRGRPKGYDHDYSLEPIVKKLSQLIGRNVYFWDEDFELCAEQARELKSGEIACLENIRFYPGEEENDSQFAKELAAIGQIYVNDAFGNIHRNHASMSAITRYLPHYAGLLLEYELKNLAGVLDTATRPVVAIIGGSKISTKIRLIKKLMRKVDYILLGGALANNVLAAMEQNVGKSKVEEDMIQWSKGLLDNKLKVPVDARVATSLTAKPRITAVGRVRKNDIILDLGPDTVALYKDIIQSAKTIIWNGPVGYFEDKRYAKATYALVDILATAKAKAYVGGGETVKAVLARKAEKKLHFVSTGGGAMLELIEGRPLPALRPLIKKR